MLPDPQAHLQSGRLAADDDAAVIEPDRQGRPATAAAAGTLRGATVEAGANARKHCAGERRPLAAPCARKIQNWLGGGRVRELPASSRHPAATHAQPSPTQVGGRTLPQASFAEHCCMAAISGRLDRGAAGEIGGFKAYTA